MQDMSASTRRYDVLQIAEAAGLSPHPNSSGLAVVRCPFHEDSRPSMLLGQRANMWRCQAGCFDGTWHKAKELAEALGMPIENWRRQEPVRPKAKMGDPDATKKALQMLDGWLGDTDRMSPQALSWYEQRGLDFRWASKYATPLSIDVINRIYREIPKGILEDSGLLYRGNPSVRYGRRDIIIIYRDQDGRPVSGQLVATAPKERSRLKYVNLRGSMYLYGMEELGHDRIIICEGVTDALTLRYATPQFFGLKHHYGVVAVPSATTWRKSWVDLFARKSVIIAFDHDEAGQTGAENAYKQLVTVATRVQIATVGAPGDDINSRYLSLVADKS